MSRGTQAVINFSHLLHNYKQLKKRAPNKLVLVVKADAYGHGLKQTVKALGEVDCFAVATLAEALLIRKHRPNVRILLLEGFLDANELHISLANHFDCVIHQTPQLELFLQLNTTQKINIWLKYDSGMNRLGFDDDGFEHAFHAIEKHKNLGELVLMSHFASANESNNDFTTTQKQRFLKHAKHYPLSLSNSAALLNQNNLTDEWCRVGLALFGVSPFVDKTAKELGLKPVMSLKTNVIAVKNIKAGQSIGYGQTYISTKAKKIAIIGLGYGDGYPWALSQNAHVKIKNHKAKILGRISMDMMAIDISSIADVSLGDAVLMWGESKQGQLPVEIVAQNAQTIAYVLLCQVTSRVSYKYE